MASAQEIQNAAKGMTFDFLGVELRNAQRWATARLLSTSAVGTLSGVATTIDGNVANNNDIVVLTAEASSFNNGPWKVQAGAWIRPTGMTVLSGMIFTISAGTANQGQWVLRGPEPTLTIDIDPLTITAAPSTLTTTLTADRTRQNRAIGVDTTGGPLTLTLPSDFPYEGLTYWFFDMNATAAGSFATNNLTLGGNGKLINGGVSLILNNFKSPIVRFNGGSYNVWGV